MRLKWRIIFLALLGAIIGVISIFFPWGGGGTSGGSGYFFDNLIEIGSYNPALTILFVLGTGVSFITSLGAAIQVISFLCAGTEYWSSFSHSLNSSSGIIPFAYGPLCAFISFALIVISMFLLLTIPPLEKPYSVKMRLLTFSKIKDEAQPINPA